MRFADIFSLSFEALVDRKIRTVLTVLMVILGSSLVVVLDGLSAGQSAFLEKQFSALADNVIFVSSGRHSYRSESSTASLIINNVIVDKIRTLPFVQDASPSYSGSFQIDAQGNIQQVRVHAMVPTKVSEILPNVEYVDGSTIEPNDRAAMIVGDTVANPPGTTTPFVTMGETIVATYTYSDSSGKQVQESKNFVVTAIMKPSGNNYLDSSIIINLDAGNEMLHKSDKYDEVTVIAEPGYNNAVQKEITSMFGSTLGVRTPQAIMAVREQATSGNAAFILMIGMIALIVGSVGIVTTLYNSVTERIREIGTIKAIGAQNLDILGLFLVEAALIGLIGATAGLAVGVVGGYMISNITPSHGPGPSTVHIPPIFLPIDLLKVWILSVLLSIAAGVFPAWKASKLSPMIALRRE